jgi:hypothetical protein
LTINDQIDDFDTEKRVSIVLDRLVVKDYSDTQSADVKRLKDSLELAFKT